MNFDQEPPKADVSTDSSDAPMDTRVLSTIPTPNIVTTPFKPVDDGSEFAIGSENNAANSTSNNSSGKSKKKANSRKKYLPRMNVGDACSYGDTDKSFGAATEQQAKPLLLNLPNPNPNNNDTFRGFDTDLTRTRFENPLFLEFGIPKSSEGTENNMSPKFVFSPVAFQPDNNNKSNNNDDKSKNKLAAFHFFSKAEPGLIGIVSSYLSLKHFSKLLHTLKCNHILQKRWIKIRETMIHTWPNIPGKQALKWIIRQNINIRDFTVNTRHLKHGTTLLGQLVQEGSDVKVINFALERMKGNPTIDPMTPNNFHKGDTQWENATVLHFAAKFGHIDLVKALLPHMTHVNSPEEKGLTALMCALLDNNVDIANILINDGNADVTCKTKRGDTALHLACHNDSLSVVENLVKKGASVTAKNSEGTIPIMFAASNKRHDILKFLLDIDSSLVNEQDDDGDTALNYAAKAKSIECVRLLVDIGANIEIANQKGCTPLIITCHTGTEAIMDLLLSKNAAVDPNTETEGVYTSALIAASVANKVLCVKTLLKSGANVKLVDFQHYTALCQASKAGHVEVAKELIEAGSDVNHRKPDGWTPLLLAASENREDVCRLLLEHGANVNIAEESGMSPLFITSNNGLPNIVDILIQNGADINFTASGRGGMTPLMAAAKRGDNANKCLLSLLHAGAKVNSQKDDGFTALHLAAINGNTKEVLALLAYGAKSNVLAKGNPVISYAAQEGHSSIVHALLSSGASPNVTCKNGWSPLHHAAKRKHLKTLMILLAADANVNLQKKDGYTSLHLATLNGHIEIVKALLNANAKVDIKEGKESATALIFASRKGHNDTVKLLLQHGAKIDNTDNSGGTALMYASKHDKSEVMSTLIEFCRKDNRVKQQIDMQKKDGYTALMLSALNNNMAPIKLLLQNGCNVDIFSKDGGTALNCACRSGHVTAVKELVTVGKAKCSNPINPDKIKYATPLMCASSENELDVAKFLLSHFKGEINVNDQKEDGWTALLLASQHGYTNMVNLLLEHSANPNIQCLKDQHSALLVAANNGHIDTVTALIKAGADTNLPRSDGNTALMLAAHNGHTEIVKALLNANAKVDLQSKSNQFSALHLSASKGHVEIIQELLKHGADIHLEDLKGSTPIVLAKLKKQVRAIELLQNAEAVSSSTGEDYKQPASRSDLVIACLEGDIAKVHSLLADRNDNNEIDVNFQCVDGKTPLVYAAGKYHDCVVALLSAGADVNIRTKKGASALMLASRTGQTETVKAILGKGAHVNAQESEGWSSLMFAISEGHTETVRALLYYSDNSKEKNNSIESDLSNLSNDRIDINMKSEKGSTALHLACQKGHLNIVELFLSFTKSSHIDDTKVAAGGYTSTIDFEIKTGKGATALMNAATNGHANIVTALIDAGADVNNQKPDGTTALMLAAKGGHTEVVNSILAYHCKSSKRAKSLKSSKASVVLDKKDKKGNTAAKLAQKNDHDDIVEALRNSGATIEDKEEETDDILPPGLQAMLDQALGQHFDEATGGAESGMINPFAMHAAAAAMAAGIVAGGDPQDHILGALASSLFGRMVSSPGNDDGAPDIESDTD